MKPISKTQQKLEMKSELHHYNVDWWDWDYDDDPGRYWEDEDIYPEYTYIDRNLEFEMLCVLLGSRYRRYEFYYNPYRVIDMNSIYSKQERRNNFIDELLGNKSSKFIRKPIFADIFKNEHNS